MGRGYACLPVVARYARPHSESYSWELEPGRSVTTVGYHRPLAWYAHALRSTGWVILDLSEPTPGPEFASTRCPRSYVEEIPLHLVVEARRERRARPAGPERAG